MPASKGGITITNLNAFRRDIKLARAASPAVLSAALRATGPSVIEHTREFASAAHQTGELEGGYKVSVARNRATLVSDVPYSAGAEWGRFGKWAGFNQYGPPGRFAWRAVEENADEIAETMLTGLREVIEILGWADEMGSQ